MRVEQEARLLRIHICEGDEYQGKPLYETIVNKCRELRIAGASVFRALEGYGETAEIHRAHLMEKDEPVIITIVDTSENIARVLPLIEEMVDTGMIATSAVKMVRIQNDAGPTLAAETGP